MQHLGPRLVKIIDKDVQDREERKKGRTHLGASVLGRECVREIWYGWRWARPEERHGGRMLRLFHRGQREEAQFVHLLRNLGLEVREYSERLFYHDGSDSYVKRGWEDEVPTDAGNPLIDVTEDPVHIRRSGETLEQYGFRTLGGHHGGNTDGQVRGLEALFPGLELPGFGLLEFKTHGEKSFIQLAGALVDWRKHVTDPAAAPFTGKGVLTAKPEHYVQMQVYMHRLGLSWALYVAVCKNTDDLYFELVFAKPELGEAYADRAAKVIAARHPPARLTNNPTWFVCKFCDFRDICHHAKAKSKNCRTCIYSKAEETGGWTCELYHQTLPPDFMPKGCDRYEEIPE